MPEEGRTCDQSVQGLQSIRTFYLKLILNTFFSFLFLNSLTSTSKTQSTLIFRGNFVLSSHCPVECHRFLWNDKYQKKSHGCEKAVFRGLPRVKASQSGNWQLLKFKITKPRGRVGFQTSVLYQWRSLRAERPCLPSTFAFIHACAPCRLCERAVEP